MRITHHDAALPCPCPALIDSAEAAASANQMLTHFDAYGQIDSASKLNNHALALMQSERLVEAIHAFRGVLNILCDARLIAFQESIVLACLSHDPWKSTNSITMTEPSLETMTATHSMLLQQYQLPSIRSCHIDSTSTTSVADHKDLEWSPHNYFSVYNRGFFFLHEQVRSHCWFRRVRLLPVVVLYNMGLAHQLLGLQRVSCQEYHTACKYYEMALHAADDARQMELRTSDYSLLVLALTNNMGFISSHEFNEQHSLYFAGRMLTTFATLDCSRLLNKDEYVFYYMNLLFVLNRYPSFAPAA
jgi:tetratricopeptide (TPR) repeat protein